MRKFQRPAEICARNLPQPVGTKAALIFCGGNDFRVTLTMGRLFGDHCSPISDTTILSSTGAECAPFRNENQLTEGGIFGIMTKL